MWNIDAIVNMTRIGCGPNVTVLALIWQEGLIGFFQNNLKYVYQNQCYGHIKFNDLKPKKIMKYHKSSHTYEFESIMDFSIKNHR